MRTHRRFLTSIVSPRAISRHLVPITLLAAFGCASAVIAASPDSTTPTGATKVYTNADLAKYATDSDDERSIVTNRHLKAPLPTQSAPIVESPGDWDFVLRMLDREREENARSREAAYAAAQAAIEEPEPAPTYSYPYPFFLGFNGNPFPHRPHRPRVPTNTFRPLDERGIRTPHELWLEARRNSQIQRSNFGPGPSDSRQNGTIVAFPRH